jgi:RimJ/RimL family protein N-acetyltransferase
MALQKILTWGNEILGISEYRLQVISTNKRAIAIYNELGFSLQKRMNLRSKNFSDGITNLVPSTKENSNTAEEMFIMTIKL